MRKWENTVLRHCFLSTSVNNCVETNSVAREGGRCEREEPTGASSATPSMDAMHFLNQAAQRYPTAISFAAGRPPSRYLGANRVTDWIRRFVEHEAARSEVGAAAVWEMLGQYSNTGGVVNDVLSEYLARAEGIATAPDAIIVTNGFQEALLIALLELRTDDAAILAFEPTYVGLSGAAECLGLHVEPIASDRPVGDSLNSAVKAAHCKGKLPKSVYVIPEFSNPSGHTLAFDERSTLLQEARKHDLRILEDTAYRSFNYDGDRLPPTLRRMDTDGRVSLLGSFAKLVMPGLRCGYLSGPRALVERCLRIKSFVSVATSPFMQAALAGYLLQRDRYAEETESRLRWCRRLRDCLLQALGQAFADDSRLRSSVTWTSPRGGFFVLLHLPFDFGLADLEHCARRYGVVVSPMSMFYLDQRKVPIVRMAFANLDEPQIVEGVRRLRRFVEDRTSA